MPYLTTASNDIVLGNSILTTKMDRLLAEKRAALQLRERKHSDWDDNYLLYRNKVKTNRLTQRQAVNIPLMKETVKTLLSKIDDLPEVEWKELSGDEQKQLYYQEVWNYQGKQNKFELIDILDKKNVLLYGLSTRYLNICDYGVEVSVLDPYDVSFDPLMTAWDLESARFIIHTNIFRSIKEIMADKRYSKEGKEKLKIWSMTPEGITQTDANKKAWEAKMERLKAMGTLSSDFPLFAGGDRVVNLTQHCTMEWKTDTQTFERRVVIYADDATELLDKSLMDLLGVEFWPYTVWSEDPETNDIYPDSIADLVRVPNKVLNVWFSQLIENRTLKNFQMHWYSPIQGYSPQTYTPGPGVMLPAPPGDDIRKVIMPVEIDGLDDTMGAIEAVTQIVERATGATAIEKGTPEKGVETLGEVKILVGQASERTTAMTKFYRMAQYELAWKWDKLMQANAPDKIVLYKIGKDGKAFPKTLYKKDWMSDAGYEPVITSQSEQETEDTKAVQRFMFVQKQYPNNQALAKIALKRELKILKLTPEELRQVEEGQKMAEEAAMPPATPPPNATLPPGPPAAPGQGNPAPAASSPADMNEISQLLDQFSQ